MPFGALVRVFGQRGESPLQVDALRPVFKGNCVLVTGGGKQPEKNNQSVTKVNSIRPDCLASLPYNGEAQTDASRKSRTLRGSVTKRSRKQWGGWRLNGCDGQAHQSRRPVRISGRCSYAELRKEQAVSRASRTGVRASIVAMKPGNAGGAKGCRETDTERT